MRRKMGRIHRNGLRVDRCCLRVSMLKKEKMTHFLKHCRKLMNAGEFKEPRLGIILELSDKNNM